MSAPGGLSVKEFELAAAEVGQWIWGMAQGAYNDKQTLSQIITDAVIGMIPLVGDVTAARDLIAVSTGLATDPKKREETVEWVLLVILLFALIPVIGGVVKGVGRIALRVGHVTAAESKLIAKAADDIIQFLNRIGHKNAQAWFRSLDVLSHQAEILQKFRGFCDTIIVSIHRYGLRFRAVLPQSLIARMEQLSHGFEQLKTLGDKMIPQALKELHAKLKELQAFVHAGGKPVPGKAKVMLAQTGQKTVTYAEEARLLEGKVAKTVRRAGKYQQNVAGVMNLDEIVKVYKYEPGFPNLMKPLSDKEKYYSMIAAASGKIENKTLSDVTIYRSFGEGGITHGFEVRKSSPTGAFWGLGDPPAAGRMWRDSTAVLDEWNRNGWLCVMRIPKDVKVPACVSTVSEQFSVKIPGQYLEGGARQAVIDIEKDTHEIAARLTEAGGGKATLRNGIEIEIRPSGWSEVNEAVGYGETVIPHASMVERLGVTEKQSKFVRQAAQVAPKNQRAGEMERSQ
jgi:nitrogen fixation protein